MADLTGHHSRTILPAGLHFAHVHGAGDSSPTFSPSAEGAVSQRGLLQGLHRLDALPRRVVLAAAVCLGLLAVICWTTGAPAPQPAAQAPDQTPRGQLRGGADDDASGALSTPTPVSITDAGLDRRNSTGELKCTAGDRALLHTLNASARQDLFAAADGCGRSNLQLGWSISFNHDGYMSCLAPHIALTTRCYECFLASAELGANTCKGPCLFSWCAPQCLECAMSNKAKVARCFGTELPAAPC